MPITPPQVNRFCRDLVDSSSQLRFLIELGRDGLYPIYIALSNNNAAANTLELHLRKRDRWNAFNLSNSRLTPPQDHEFHIYEFTGGMLAHCVPGPVTDSISIQSLAVFENETEEPASLYQYQPRTNGGYHLPLPFKCAEFSFDPTQDLLVAVEHLSP